MEIRIRLIDPSLVDQMIKLIDRRCFIRRSEHEWRIRSRAEAKQRQMETWHQILQQVTEILIRYKISEPVYPGPSIPVVPVAVDPDPQEASDPSSTVDVDDPSYDSDDNVDNLLKQATAWAGNDSVGWRRRFVLSPHPVACVLPIGGGNCAAVVLGGFKDGPSFIGSVNDCKAKIDETLIWREYQLIGGADDKQADT